MHTGTSSVRLRWSSFHGFLAQSSRGEMMMGNFQCITSIRFITNHINPFIIQVRNSMNFMTQILSANSYENDVDL